MRLGWMSRNPGIFGWLFVFFGFAPLLEARPSGEIMLESATALEHSAVKLHQAYTSWLRKTGRFEERRDDGLYTDLCAFRNCSRAVAWQIRDNKVSQLYGNQVHDIMESIDTLARYRDYPGLDPALRELMRNAWSLAGTFRGAYDSLLGPAVAPPEESAAPVLRGAPRLGHYRLLPNRFDIMNCLESR